MKTYRSKKGGAICVVVMVEGQSLLIRLNNFDRTLEVSDGKVQAAIEDSRLFREGEIEIVGEEKGCVEGVAPLPSGPDTAYNGVRDINGAVEILKGDPYLVPAVALRTPEMVRKQAKLKGVSFPNWE
jgi:hypothetical protein